MKKTGIFILCTACLITLFAQDKLYLHKTDNSVVEMLISSIDSITFTNNDTELNIHKTDNTVSNFPLSDIDNISFVDVSKTISINYSGNTVNVINPLVNQGVTVTQNGANVIIASSVAAEDLKYVLTGSTTNGSVKIYSDFKFELVLNGVSMTNPVGPAINIQSSKKITVTLAPGTTNTLTDGATYSTSTEDQKSTFFSEGQLVFGGSGSLTVKSFTKHAICSDDYIEINEGNITVTGAGKDGIHSKDYFRMKGGSVNITATGDGIDCEEGHVIISEGNITTFNTVTDTKGITSDSTMTITGGTIHQTISGSQSKGLKSKQAMTISGGSINIVASGGVVISVAGLGFDPSYCTGIKCGTDLTLSGGNITITSTSKAGKGISSDGNIVMTTGTVNISTTGAGATYTNSAGLSDSYNATCITADGNISLLGGSVTTSSTGVGGVEIFAKGTVTYGN